MTLNFDLWPWPLNSSKILCRFMPTPNLRFIGPMVQEWEHWQMHRHTDAQMHTQTDGTDSITSTASLTREVKIIQMILVIIRPTLTLFCSSRRSVHDFKVKWVIFRAEGGPEWGLSQLNTLWRGEWKSEKVEKNFNTILESYLIQLITNLILCLRKNLPLPLPWYEVFAMDQTWRPSYTRSPVKFT